MKKEFLKLIKILRKLAENKKFRSWHPYLLSFLVLISIYSLSIAMFNSIPLKSPNSDITILIPKGSSFSQITDTLEINNIISNRKLFYWTAKLKKKTNSLKAGYFNLKNAKSYSQLINILSTSQNITVRITIPEGLQAREIAKLLSKKIDIEVADFILLLKNKSLLKKYNIKADNLEGYLFPDTYEFYKTESARQVITKLIDHFFSKLDRPLQKEIYNSGRNVNEVLTLASLIEGECMIDSERPLVASLYLNRLEKNMRLEADPTIQYIIPDGPRRLLKKDLYIESPYNTYRHRGLPPGPINNPGFKSILAAIYPSQTNYLYMVAAGDGSHSFTYSYDQFLRAKRKFQKIRRQTTETN